MLPYVILLLLKYQRGDNREKTVPIGTLQMIETPRCSQPLEYVEKEERIRKEKK